MGWLSEGDEMGMDVRRDGNRLMPKGDGSPEGTQRGWLDSHPLTSENVLNSRLFADLELILADAAQWAYPILRDIFKCSSRGNSAVRVSCSRIVNVSADYTNILFHFVFNLSGITFRHRTPPGVPLCRYSNLAIYHIQKCRISEFLHHALSHLVFYSRFFFVHFRSET